ncbi:hypothetical protein ACSBM8_12830 [Sphingomonas sp. ASY06-1R]|uniref:hypothetical protein n=1 Tax=Sphingomonas sp. ASY06-1R TaxID=3445771 RepID=UPI003FA1F12E
MRLLLLLSAFLTALTGAMTGTAASAQPVVASASATQAQPGVATRAQHPLPQPVPAAVLTPQTWRAPAPLTARSAPDSFGERRRE